jgi:hypothetical protein
LHPNQKFACEGEIPQQENHQCGGNPNPEAEFPAVLRPDFPDMAVHGFGVDVARAANAAQVGEQPLKARSDFFCVLIGLL